MNVALIAAGGAIGSVARYGVSTLVQRFTPSFPAGTFVVNLIGCLCFGVIVGISVRTRALLSPASRAFLLTGVLGGFTTFSSFTYETHALLLQGDLWRAVANVAGQVILGLGAFWAGYALMGQ